jgi:hypothetical protein
LMNICKAGKNYSFFETDTSLKTKYNNPIIYFFLSDSMSRRLQRTGEIKNTFFAGNNKNFRSACSMKKINIFTLVYIKLTEI